MMDESVTEEFDLYIYICALTLIIISVMLNVHQFSPILTKKFIRLNKSEYFS